MLYLSPDEQASLVTDILRKTQEDRKTELTFSCLPLSDLPDDVFAMTWLKSLNAAGLTPISESIARLILENAREKAVDGFADGVSISDLEARLAEQMQPAPASLSFLSERIGELTELEELNLSNQSLTRLPDAICSLPRLRRLSLANNPLRELPADFARLTSLVMLDLRETLIEQYPAGFEQMPVMNPDYKAKSREARHRRNMAIRSGDYEAAADAYHDEMRWGYYR